MSDLTKIFSSEAKVVISPDEMRAWVMLPPPSKGAPYTVDAVTEWLPQQGVVYGVRKNMIVEALASEKYYELLEVARGDTPVDPIPGRYTLRGEIKPFTGLRANSDGSLLFDDLSFLREAAEGEILADIEPPTPGMAGKSVRGETVEPKEAEETAALAGSGFELSEDGLHYVAPGLSHLNMVNQELIVTPLLKRESLSAADGPPKLKRRAACLWAGARKAPTSRPGGMSCSAGACVRRATLAR